jgi:DNA-binding response OmpR family regulator
MANVLLIEPNKVLARTYARALTQAGHQVCHARGAQEAIDEADAHTPDVIVLEPQLAGQDGIAFLHELRSYGEWQAVPVILHTYLAPSRLEAVKGIIARDLGVTICLYKPKTTLEQLIRVVGQQARRTDKI